MKHTKIFLFLILLVASFLRLWKLSEVPVSMFGDELDVGYHAYSILKTGKDYSGNFMPLHFHSLAEWRTPLYLYSAVPTVGMFGVSPLGVRLPAAIFGILGVYGIYLFVNQLFNGRWKLETRVDKEKEQIGGAIALVAALILAINPWHIQYSRAGFEVTMLLSFLIFGLYFFLKSIRANGRLLWLSVLFLVSTPLIYSTAKLFVPLFLCFLFITYFRKIVILPKKTLVMAVLVGLVVGIPTVYGTLWSGGTERFGYISVFSDPTIEPEVGSGRLKDAAVRGELVTGLNPSIEDRVFHNKVVFWIDRIMSNYLGAFSTEFLFNEGDPNLRHSIKGIGQFYKIEAVALILGLVFLFSGKVHTKTKFLIGFWIIAGVIPSAITRDGGNHATRLILILPPLTILMSYGLVLFNQSLSKKSKFVFLPLYFGFWILSFVFYQHSFWVHNPWDSERWWHSGWQESVQTIKQVEKDYDKVIITMSDEPAWTFFAAWYEYDPNLWHKENPIGNDTFVNGWGNISHTGKFYFGSFHPETGGIYDLPKYIDNKTLYMASAKEIGANLIQEPGRTPLGLDLIKAVPYPSGEPAFYLFTGK